MLDTTGHDKPIQKGLFSTLRAKMLLYFGLAFGGAFLMVSLIFTFGVPFTEFQGEYRAEESEAFQKLEMVAELKKKRLERWLFERKGDARVLAESEIMESSLASFRSAFMELTASGMGKQEAWEKIREKDSYRTLLQHLGLVKAAYGFYEDIDIAETETGEIFASTSESELGKNIAANDFFIQPLLKPGIYVNFERNAIGRRDFDFFVSHSIKERGASGENNKPAAVLVMIVNADDFTKSMLHTGAGLGQTGEVMLFNQEAQILTPLKYPLPDGTRPAPLAYQIQSKPVMLAVQGKEGIIEAEDYRGVPVLASLRHIQITSGTSWGMVVKQDRSEVLAELKWRVTYFFVVFAFAIVLLAALTYRIATGLSLPIHLLGQTAQQLESGDLHARSPVTGPYEVAVLATAFNSMAQRLQGWHEELEGRIRERTSELATANAELERQSKFLEAVLDCVEDGIVACDNNAVLTLFNRATRKFHGLPQKSIPAEKWADHYDLFLADGKTPMKMEDVPLFRTLKGEAVDNVEMTIAPKDGSPRTLLATGRALMNNKGEKMGAVVSMHDITTRKQVEEELKLYRENLEKMVEERTSELKAANEKLSKEILYRKQAEESVKLERDKLMGILNAIEDGVYIVNRNYDIEFINPVIEKEFGPVKGRKCFEYFHDRQKACPWCKNEEVHAGKSVQWEWYSPKNNRHYELFDTPIKNEDGSVSKFEIFHDITARKRAEEQIKKALEEKELLLLEVHHRVKNNMQIISSLLNMQSRSISDERVKGIFQDCRNRIKSMATVHEKLYSRGDFERIDFREYIRSVSSDLFKSYAGVYGRVAFKPEVEDEIFLRIDSAIPCGLILNELITNSLKHAFPEGRTGELRVAMRKVPDSNKYELTVADNGVGLQEGEGQGTKKEESTLGLTLIDTLVSQLNGVMEVKNKKGTEYRITFEERMRKDEKNEQGKNSGGRG